MALFDELVGTNDLARYLSGVRLQNAATQYIPTAAQEAESARQMRNAFQAQAGVLFLDCNNQLRVIDDEYYLKLTPAGWRDWFDCGDELV